MSRLKLEIDSKAIADLFEGTKKEVERDLYDAVEIVARRSEAKTRELAAEQLHSRFNLYDDGLKFQEIGKGMYLLELDESALWIEEGRDAGSMVDDLLRKNPKISKKGEKYKSIPFEHSKLPSQQTQKARQITEMIKTELKKRNIPYKKIEFDKSGNPRLGLIHTIKDIQGPKPSKSAKHGALEGLAIYQTKTKTGKIKRDIMTFRVVKESHKQEGLWYHPGLEGVQIFDQVYDWALKEFDKILQEIYSAYGQVQRGGAT